MERARPEGLRRIIDYLSKSPIHPALGIPVIDPLAFLIAHDDCTCNLMLGKPLEAKHSLKNPMAIHQLFNAGMWDVDGPFLGGVHMAYAKAVRNMFGWDKDMIKCIQELDHGELSTRLQMKGIMKSWRRGDFRPVILRCVNHMKATPEDSGFMHCYLFLIVCQSPDPSVPTDDLAEREAYKRMLSDGPRLCNLTFADLTMRLSDPRVYAGTMRDHMAVKRTPMVVVMVDEEGYAITQNAVALWMLGVVGQEQQELGTLPDGVEKSLPPYKQGAKFNYLIELFNNQATVKAVLKKVRETGILQRRLIVTSPVLLKRLQVPPKHVVQYDVYISQLTDPASGADMFMVAQIDVSNIVAAESHLHQMQVQQKALLHKMLPQQVVDVLLSAKSTVGHLDVPATPLDVTQQRPGALGRVDSGEDLVGAGAPLPASGLAFARTFRVPNPVVQEHPDLEEEQEEGEGEGQGGGGEVGSQLMSCGPDNSELGQGQGGIGVSPSKQAICKEAAPEHVLLSVALGSENDVLQAASRSAFSSTSGKPPQVQVEPLQSQTSMSSSDAMWVEQLSTVDVQRLSTYHQSVSILFTDIEGFTAMSQQLHPSQVMLFLNNLYSVFDSLLEEFDVYKVETIGDTYMVCAGLFDRQTQVSTPLPAATPPARWGERSKTLERRRQRKKDVLGGLDPDHGTKILGFAKALLRAAAQVPSPWRSPSGCMWASTVVPS